MPARVYLEDKICPNCGKTFGRDSCCSVSDFRVKKFCTRECWAAYRVGENHPNWKGGVKTRPDGYLRDSKTDKYIHRVVMEEFLGRKLKQEEQVHHKDGNPSNNSIDNLELFDSNSNHRKFECSNQKRGEDGRFTT